MAEVKPNFEFLPLSAIVPNPKNPRSHSRKQIRDIANSIQAFGFNAPILVDGKRQIIAGHGRLVAAKLLGMEKVPTIGLQHLTEAQAKAYMIADNKLTDQSIFDEEVLAGILKELSEISLDFDIQTTGFSIPEIDLRIHALSDEKDLDDADDIELWPGTAVSGHGDVWKLGRHRLVCGDALDFTIYQSVLDGKRASAAFTDAPYNLKVDGVVSGKGKIKHREFAMASGEMTSDEFAEFLSKVIANLIHHVRQDGLIYACMDWRSSEELARTARTLGLKMINLCVWVKTNGGMGSLYRSQHELIYVFRNGDGQHRNNIQLGRFGRNRTNVWTYPGANVFTKGSRNKLLKLHPTVKPLQLVADAILDCTAPGDVVLDCFLGSGTTLLAAERTGRIGAGIELDPLYVDTAIRRWQKMTGQEAVHVTGLTFGQMEKERGTDIGEQ